MDDLTREHNPKCTAAILEHGEDRRLGDAVAAVYLTNPVAASLTAPSSPLIQICPARSFSIARTVCRSGHAACEARTVEMSQTVGSDPHVPFS